MTFKKRYFEYLISFLAILFITVTVIKPEVCALGAKKGLAICAKAIIPSLFPFAVPVLFLTNTTTFSKIKRKRLAIFALSLIGGYPIGGRLIHELYKNNDLEIYEAEKMLPFCVNAGPAFVVIAVGKGILDNTLYGYILLASHILSSIILSSIFVPKILFSNKKSIVIKKEISISDNFVLSVHSASSATISICAFVIIFSVINEYIIYYSHGFKALYYLTLVTEVTSAVTKTDNLYLISFLLGFAGVSIWMQIISVAQNIKPSIFKFIAVRILHGTLSALVTTFIVRLFSVSVSTISNSVKTYEKAVYSSTALSISLLIMSIMLLISITAKKHSGNILEDVL